MDFRSVGIRALTNIFKLFGQDLEALPEEAYTKSFGPATRTVADIVYEVNLVNEHVLMVIKGEKPFDWPDDGFIKAPAEFASKIDVMAAFEKCRDRVLESVEKYSVEEFEAVLQTDEGETTRYNRCQFMTLHMWYHSGQLNFIQTLVGDDKWNWS